MRVRLAGPGRPRAWSVEAPRGATLGELAELAGFGRVPYVAVDGWLLSATCEMHDAGVVDGTLVTPAVLPPGASLVLVAVDESTSGRRWALRPGRTTVGRHPANDLCLADPEVRARHVEVTLLEQGAVQVAWFDEDTPPVLLGPGEDLVVGATRLRLELADPGPPGTSGPLAGDTPHGPRAPVGLPPAVATVRNRPPRPVRAPQPPFPTRPSGPPAPARGATLRSLTTMLVPALAGVALAAALRPEFVALALVAPAGALVTWLVLRGLDVHASRAHRAARRDADATYRAAFRAACDARRDRLHVRHPDLDAVAARVATHDVRLWERRPTHDDFLRVAPGRGQVRVDVPAGEEPTTVDAPVELDLDAPIGIVGDRAPSRALARSLVLQIAAHHGPADLSIRAWTDDPCAWQWLAWLPHAPDLVVCADTDAVEDDGRDAANSARDRRAVVLLDANGVPPAWRTAWRSFVDHGAAIVIATRAHELPEQCRTVIHLGQATASVHDLATGGHTPLHGPWMLDAERAETLAARLAPLRDPDATVDRTEARSPGLLPLLGHHRGDDLAGLTAIVTRRWASARRTGRAAAPIGTTVDGPLVIDLDDDGPHALVAGTTGSGKSELLRSLVLGLAASVDPQHLAFVLVDYKGGSAFDGLHPLPHVVDVVTDLDLDAADRARRGLDAEVLRRERVLRAAGASDLASYHRADRPGHEPLPRLVIVIDELATLVHEMSSFVDALVDIAQRGRSLGIHLVLATQRPSGAVKDSIRTNTNLRVALRVLDSHDSRDVLDADDAAAIPRRCRGRGFARLGAGELCSFQSAYTGGPAAASEPDRLRMVPLGLPAVATPPGTPSEVDLLVHAVSAAHREIGGPEPRRPWTDSLPTTLSYPVAAGFERDGGLLLGVLDDPEAQAHRAYTWSSGNLLVAGLAGSGASEVVGVCIADAVARPVAERPQVYVIAASVVRHEWATARPEVGAVIAVADVERVTRLLRMLAERVDECRLGRVHEAPEIVVLVDGIATLRAAFDTVAGFEVLDRLERLAADGPAVGVRFAFVADHPGDLGHRLDRTVSRRLLLRLGDRSDYLGIGRRDVDPATLSHGRGVDAATGHRVQLATLDPATITALELPASDGVGAAPGVGTLPETVVRDHLDRPTIDEAGGLYMPVGIGDDRLAPVAVRLGAGEHLLVVGGPRCAKSALLSTMRGALADAGIPTVVLGTARTPIPGAIVERAAIAGGIDGLLAAAPAPAGVVLVDDADAVDDGGVLEWLVTAGPPQVHVIAAGRTDRLRPLLRHWTTELRRGGHAVLLRGDDADAELTGVRLPRDVTVRGPGRGWLVRDGDIERCQFALDPVAHPDVVAGGHHALGYAS